MEKVLMKQGAEARIHCTNFLGRDCIIKERFKKTYRHPALDQTLTSQRLKSEARALLRCRQMGIAVPAVYNVDMEENCIYMEHLRESITLKDYIDDHLAKADADNLKMICSMLGNAIAVLHKNHIVHGDLTTSNVLVRSKRSSTPSETCELVFIDFGLTTIESAHIAEDKGVDLYVLERAFLSTHPNTETFFSQILDSYKSTNSGECGSVLSKFEEIRLRGRKRTMVG